MIYLDTNVFVYALSSNVDDIAQKEKALQYLKEAIEEDNLLVSEVILYEFAFVSKKMGEEISTIKNGLEFLADFVEDSKDDIFSKVIAFMNKYSLYRHSFDVYHLCYADVYECERLITFDRGFKKLQKYTNIKIEIL